MTLNIRPATIEDAPIATALLVETNGGFGVEVLGFGNPDLQFSALKQWFVDSDNRFSYQCCSIAEKYGIAAGLLLGIPGSRLDSLQFGCVRRLFSIYSFWGGLKMIWGNKSMAGNKEAEADEYLIAHLGVDEHFRRQGIAQALLEKAEQDAHALNFTKLVLDVEMNNDKAIALYQKSGFIEADAIFYGDKAEKFKSPGYFKMFRTI
jgi:ribosomal protein S18 acetylase RimI-like enzyme